MTESVTVRAAAKVNLHLGVGRPRPDGYHPLATVYQTLSLHDDVTVSTRPGWEVELVCEDDEHLLGGDRRLGHRLFVVVRALKEPVRACLVLAVVPRSPAA